MKKLTKEEGFTLVELMLAMVVFSAVLVIFTVGFIAMNRVFSRGVIRRQLSEGVQITTEDFTRTLRSELNNIDAPVACDGRIASNTCAVSNWVSLNFPSTCYLWNGKVNNSPVYGLYKTDESCSSRSPDSKVTLVGSQYLVDSLQIDAVSDATNVKGLYRIAGVFRTTNDLAIDFTDPIKCKGTTEQKDVTSCAVEAFNFIVNTKGSSS